MIRRIFPIMAVLAVVGFAPALAQDIFINKNKSKDGEAPSLFIKKSSSETSSVQYGAKQHLQKKKQQTLAKLKTYKEIRESGLKPTTMDEVKLVGEAQRALAVEVMQKRRAALSKHINKIREVRQAEIEAQVSSVSQGALKVDAPVSGVVQKKAVQSSKPSNKSAVPKIYVRKSDDDKAKPSKVFTDYR